LDSSQGKEEDTINIGVLVDCVDLVPKPKVSVFVRISLWWASFLFYFYIKVLFSNLKMDVWDFRGNYQGI
jgi:hypothetical protein